MTLLLLEDAPVSAMSEGFGTQAQNTRQNLPKREMAANGGEDDDADAVAHTTD